jgi:hypothetical protein
MSESEQKEEVVVPESVPAVSAKPATEIAAPVATAEIKPDHSVSAKSVPAVKHAPRKLDKFAERRAELKRQKRVAHRRRIAASNTPG